ncbi:hypothetical protein BOW53_07685 [Solemya pervernicosa gill symbiont]|uniref:Uncharacterized protein n=2 Tax=Gammaproteobacteria incertae sedis TaxID=118884 RepID=A0A1T2L5Q7_9GAMM|nr:hypothetical protein [Candidatus Reidiella endopervernicosa]OOZ40447.1 hypothetical protein BOW53_07685 [Solemya pervernicosa gill symbiont]QKQ25361.1 hypothetical protein HUE57_02945 [Candidatus Reidiella endopervernicosa]
MKPILTVEFSANAAGRDFNEESVTIHTPEELFQFVAPGGGCEKIPDEVSEIQFTFLPPEHPNTINTIADRPATLSLGMAYFSGPLSEIVETSQQILDKAGRGELSLAFIEAISAGS